VLRAMGMESVSAVATVLLNLFIIYAAAKWAAPSLAASVSRP
jgi:succinate dehydrogenase hydrophobic anchor subunit